MKWLTKDISKRANCDNQKVIEDILNITTDIETIASVNNWVNNSVRDLTNRIINFFGTTICYMNNKRYYLFFGK